MSSSIQIWNRLECEPRINSFDRALRAEVRDALWMISSQWRIGEFNGDDTGTAANAFLDMQTSRIDRIAKRNGIPTPINDDLPLECTVERENISPDLMHRLETGRQFLKFFLSRMKSDLSLSDPTMDTALDEVRNSSQLRFSSPSVPLDNPQFYSSPELWQATEAVSGGRGIDGYVVKTTLSITSVVSFSATQPLLGDLLTALSNAHSDFIAWYNKTFPQPAATSDNYWQQQHLEYDFSCSAPKDGGGFTVLNAREYYHGHLDWYSFNIQDPSSPHPHLSSGTPQIGLLKNNPFTVIPSKITFGGMPAPRYWEMEDRRVDFADLKASKTDTATILVTDFALRYSNDWTLLPYTVPVGSILNLRKVLVTDVFGQVTYIKSGNGQKWNMFTLTTENSTEVNSRLFVPPVIHKKEESDPYESVTFLRDEMANMVWAVETLISDGVSQPQPGKEAGVRLVEFLEANTTPGTVVNPVSNTAKLKYNLMTRVPEHWIPYIPVNKGTHANHPEVQLQRAAMPRQILDNLPNGRVRPRTRLVQSDAIPPNSWPRSYIFEEEVPRAGAVLTMSWQRARWQHGKVALWIGREKTNGRGEANSGLKFDYLTEK